MESIALIDRSMSLPDDRPSLALFNAASLAGAKNQPGIPDHIRELLPNFQPMSVGRSPRPFTHPDWLSSGMVSVRMKILSH